MGKAHLIALTKSGEVYSFGMNNKGQCGRDYPAAKDGAQVDGIFGAGAEAAADEVNTSDTENEQSGINLLSLTLCLRTHVIFTDDNLVMNVVDHTNIKPKSPTSRVKY